MMTTTITIGLDDYNQIHSRMTRFLVECARLIVILIGAGPTFAISPINNKRLGRFLGTMARAQQHQDGTHSFDDRARGVKTNLPRHAIRKSHDFLSSSMER